MARSAIKASTIASLILFCVLEVLPRPAFSDTCSNGTGVPPFLGAETVKPNLLLMIDNSRSMYDLSYVESLSSCYDDSYAPDSLKYAGYFLTMEQYENDDEVWYEFNATDNLFYQIPKDDSGAIEGVTTKCAVNYDGDGIAGPDYESSGGDGRLDVDEDIDGDGRLDVNEDIDGDGNLDVNEDTIIVNGILDPGEDIDGDGRLDVNEDIDGDGRLDVNEDIDGDCNLDVNEDTIIVNGILDPGEDQDYNHYPNLAEYSIIDAAGDLQHVCVIMAEEDPNYCGRDDQEFKYFAATGKFLNWLVGSNMDMQKLALTGGKMVDPDGTTITNADGSISGSGDEYLVPESRGCNEQKMIKEITVAKNGIASNSARLTLAVRADGQDEVDDSGEGFINDTFIDIYGATSGGFDNESCESALGKFLAGGAPGTWKGDLEDCLGFDKNDPNELISAYNEGTQECWQIVSKGGPPPDGTWRLTDVAATKNRCESFYIGGTVGNIPVRYNPWQLTSLGGTSVTGAFCNGKFDDPSVYPNFVGRCWVPPGQSYTIAANEYLKSTPVLADKSIKEDKTTTQDWSGYSVSETASNTELQPENTEAAVTAATVNQEELSPERLNVIQALKEFIATKGSNYYRAEVIRAVKEFFVAEVDAATFDIEETAANCTGNPKIVNGAIGGNAYEYAKSDETCYFGASTLAAPVHGYYYIHIKAPCEGADDERRSDVPLKIEYEGGFANTTFDQVNDCGTWVKLTAGATGPEDSYELAGDGTGGVLLTTIATGGGSKTYTYADAVRYELKDVIAPPPGPCDVDPDDTTYFEAEDETVRSSTNFQHPVSPEIEGKIDRVGLGPLDPPAEYYLNFTVPGIYYVWLLATAPSGSGGDNSAWYGLDGTVVGNISVQNTSGSFPTNEQWINQRWTSGNPWDGPLVAQIKVTTPGAHSFNLWSREAGFKINRIALTKSSGALVEPGWVLTPDACSDLEPPEPPTPIQPCEPGTIDRTGLTTGAWICDECIEQAVLDFCQGQLDSDVIDPSNPLDTSDLGDYLIGDGYMNAPGLWWFGAVEGQLGVPLVSMSSRVALLKPDGSVPMPSGLISEYGTQIRMGVMRFRSMGTYSECGDYGLFQYCSTDGAQVVVPIDIGLNHIQNVIDTINETDGTTWTPLAEAMYTAIGYYTQNPDMRLNDITDYPVNSDEDITGLVSWQNNYPYFVDDKVIETIINSDGDPQDIVYVATAVGSSGLSNGSSIHDDQGVVWEPVNDPVIAHCQRNFVLSITEGQSTADLNANVVSFAQANGDPADTVADVGTPQSAGAPSQGCDALKGSTYFDDLAYYGWHGSGIYKYEPWQELDAEGNPINQKNNIELHMADTRSARDDLTDECLPSELLASVAENTHAVRYVDIDGDGAFDTDITGDGINDSDWPLYYAGDPNSLYVALKKVFDLLSEQSSSGSAASVISASRSGEGALYQALFWPDAKTNLGAGNPEFVEWTGQVHAFLVDADGNLREDTNGNAILEETIDQKLIVAFDNEAGTTKACYGTYDPVTGCSVPTEDLYKVKYLWNVADWLNNPRFELADTVGENRITYTSFTADANGIDLTPRRYIFTWNDLDNDGVVSSNEVLPFTEYLGTGGPSFPAVTATDREPVPLDFGIEPGDPDAAEKVNRIINWIRGEDQPEVTAGISGATLPAMRGRMMKVDMNLDDTPETNVYWKLGDVIHSTPVTVARPAENYNLLYRDTTYAQFSRRWLNRRHMVYFGGNDGMLHAVNGGFYNEGLRRFCRNASCSDVAADLNGTPVLGQEMWAYVPYNLLPHLSCLTDPAYEHKYYVDLRPRIFDVQIFDEESACDPDSYSPPNNLAYQEPGCIHPNGWGTILVSGMRFGGAKVRPSDFDDDGIEEYPNDNREFASSYFVFDITNPEAPPVLLGEITRTIDDTIVDDFDGDGSADGSHEIELGYTTVIPTVVPMNDGTDTTWYLMLGSGPTSHNPTVDAIEGTSDQSARLAVIPLHDRMNPNNLKSLRIPAAPPVEDIADPNTDFGTIYVTNSDGTPYANSFTADLITVDLETQQQYKADVVYFGTINGDWTDGVSPDGWGGRLYRLVTRKPGIIASGSSQVVSRPYEWVDLLDNADASLDRLNPNILYDPGQPIVSPATVGTDGLDFWVYFGTGRFFDEDDKIDPGSNEVQTFYGIREPIECSSGSYGGINWKTVTNTVPTGPPPTDGLRGDLGLLPVEKIAILPVETYTGLEKDKEPGVVNCYDSGSYVPINNTCIPGIEGSGNPLETNASFYDLVQYIVGGDIYCSPNPSLGSSPGFDGWSKDLLNYKERNLGQATLLGGLLSFSTYIPNVDVCNPEGSGYLYGTYYQTGTAWYEDVFARNPIDYTKPIETSVFLGKGLSTTPNIHVGEQEGGKAFIQTSVGQIVEIPQPNLPIKDIKPGRIKWRDIE